MGMWGLVFNILGRLVNPNPIKGGQIIPTTYTTRVVPLLPNFFSVDFYDLKCQGHPTKWYFEKIPISLQFRPSVIRGPWVMLQSTLNTCLRMQKINISTFLVVRYFKTTLISFMLMLICNFFNCATFWPDIDLIRSVNTFLQTFVIFFYLLAQRGKCCFEFLFVFRRGKCFCNLFFDKVRKRWKWKTNHIPLQNYFDPIVLHFSRAKYVAIVRKSCQSRLNT